MYHVPSVLKYYIVPSTTTCIHELSYSINQRTFHLRRASPGVYHGIHAELQMMGNGPEVLHMRHGGVKVEETENLVLPFKSATASW